MPGSQQTSEVGDDADFEFDAEQQALLGINGTASSDAAAKPAAAAKTQSDVSASEAATIREATRQGWRPKEEFQGPAEEWVDASTFIDRGQKFKHHLQQRLSKTEAELAGFKKTAEQFRQFHAETMARKDAELASAIRDLRIQRTEAIRDGDAEGAVVLEDRIDVLKDQQRESKAKAEQDAKEANVPAGPDPVMQAWVEDGNQWFVQDLKMQQYAVALAEELVAKGETLRGRPLLDKLQGIMREEFPHKFGNPLRQRAASTEASSSAAASSSAGAKSAKDLPAVDRKLMRDFVAQGWTTEAEFLKSYFSRNK